MKLKAWAAFLLPLSLVAVSCDDTTDTLGQSLTDAVDYVVIKTDTFTVTTRSIKADSVLSRTTKGNLGRIKDPETGTYITCDFTTQFHVLDDIVVWPKDSLYYYKNDGIVRADSCILRFLFTDYIGDSLAPMKATLYELAKPMYEDRLYYSGFDPAENGYLRTDENAIRISKTYTACDYTIDEDEREDDDYYPSVNFTLTGAYTDKNGNTYENFGSYVLQMYYEHPEYFENSLKFAKNVCPGFCLKLESGVGNMIYVDVTNLSIFYSIQVSDTVGSTYMNLSGTEEMLQHTTVSNDAAIDRLVEDETCTYLKTPAGIFTEMTIPVEEIIEGHENDTLNTAEVVLTRLNNEVKTDYDLPYPTTLLMIQKDSLYNYFENSDIPDYKESFLAVYSSNTYTFHNISGLVRHMYDLKQSGKASEDWNKVVIIPVETTLNSSSLVTKVNHKMSLSSTKLVGGSQNPNGDIKINVIYSKFSDEE